MAQKKKQAAKKKSSGGILIIIVAIIVVIFGALWFLTNSSNDKKTSESGLYGDYKIQHQSTIDQLDDKNYQNIISPADLEKQIKDGKDTYAYFFSPECEHCKNATPKLMPLADQANIKINQYNILEFTEGWQQYNIEATPTLVYFKDGKEVGRIVGDQPEENFTKFFEDMEKQ